MSPSRSLPSTAKSPSAEPAARTGSEAFAEPGREPPSWGAGAAGLLSLQRTVGNQAVQRLIGPTSIQRQTPAPKPAPAFQTGDLVTANRQINWLSDLYGEAGAMPLPPVASGTLLKLGQPHPKGGGTSFFATVMKSATEPAEGLRPGIVNTGWIKPAAGAPAAPTPAPAAPPAAASAPAAAPRPLAEQYPEPVWIETGDKPAPPNAQVDQDARYIDRKATAVGWSIQMGHYIVLFGEDEMPFALDNSLINPGMVGPLNVKDTVYPSWDEALKNLGTAAYTYALSTRGTIIPTTFSPSSTPRIMAMIEDVRKKIAEYAQEMMDVFTIQAVALAGVIVLQVAVPIGVNAAARKAYEKYQTAPVRQQRLPEQSGTAGKRPAGAGESAESEPRPRAQAPKEEVVSGALWQGKDKHGHDLYVTRDLRFFRCTTCDELEMVYQEILALAENKVHRQTLGSIRDDFAAAQKLADATDPAVAAGAKPAKDKASQRLEELANTLADLKAKRSAGTTETQGQAKPQAAAAPAKLEIPKLTPPADPKAEVRVMNREAVDHLVAARGKGAKGPELADLYEGMKLQIEAEADKRHQDWRAVRFRAAGKYHVFVGQAGLSLAISEEGVIYIGMAKPGKGALIDQTPKVTPELGFHYAEPDLNFATSVR